MMQKSPLHIHVSVRNQELKLRRGRKIIRRYPVSTSRFGLGSEKGAASIEVRWPSGVLQTLREVHADQILKLEEPD